MTAALVRFSQEYENILIFIVLPAFLSAHKTTLHETNWLFKLQEKGHTPLLEDWLPHVHKSITVPALPSTVTICPLLM